MKALNVDTLGQTKNSGTKSREKNISSSGKVAVRESGHLFHFDNNNGTGCVELRVTTYMLHGDIKHFSRLARTQLGNAGFGLHDNSFSWKQELSLMLGSDNANKIVEQQERNEARQNIELEYDYNNMTLNTPNNYREEVRPTLELIEQYQPQLKLYHTKGEIFWKFRGKKNDSREVNIYRLEAPDGYCFDYELDEFTNDDGDTFDTAHVKFIMQRNTNQQGNGIRMHRHVEECTDVLFRQGLSYVWGMAARLNQFAVRNTRHGQNWRSSKVRLTDAHGKKSPSMVRLLGMYLRNGWIRLHEQKEGEELIAYFSSDAIKYMVDRLGNDALEEFKYSRNYEKLISDYKI